MAVNKRLRVIFLGMVQGVGFRYMTERTARRHPVTGFVRNLSDGSVEAVAEGSQEALRDFLADIRSSHLGSSIRETKTEWSQGTGEFRGFEITF
jgi:acylphosphatase